MGKAKKKPSTTLKKDHIPSSIKRKVKEDGWDPQGFRTMKFHVSKTASTQRSTRGCKPADVMPMDMPPIARYSAGHGSRKPRAVSPLFLHDISQPRLETALHETETAPQEPGSAISTDTLLHPHGIELHDMWDVQVPSSNSGVDEHIYETPLVPWLTSLPGMPNGEMDGSGGTSLSPATFILSAASSGPGSAPYYLDGLQTSRPSGGCDLDTFPFQSDLQAHQCDESVPSTSSIPSDANIADELWTSPSLSMVSSFSAPSPESVASILQQIDTTHIALPSETYNQPVQTTEVYQHDMYRDKIMGLCGESVDLMSCHGGHPSQLDDYNPTTACTAFQAGNPVTGPMEPFTNNSPAEWGDFAQGPDTNAFWPECLPLPQWASTNFRNEDFTPTEYSDLHFLQPDSFDDDNAHVLSANGWPF
ncbi:hypothetical protein B0H21DRAFT_855852 [Amylocystis lapponica]|nr:hypothetical protein B0H21DRAFT_855852 [Amylocystis lapponica]